MKILNLFSGIGGNRELWDNNHNITAVEYDPKIAEEYSQNFPNDEMIVGDAWQYLEENFHKFDIIWASPPCVTHTILMNWRVGNQYNNDKKTGVKLPDLKLYSLILFLKSYFRGNWVVENVKPYYEPLIKPTCIRGRHIYWSNIPIPSGKSTLNEIGGLDYNHCMKTYIRGKKEDQKNRNKVNPIEGKLILDYLMNKNQKRIEDYG